MQQRRSSEERRQQIADTALRLIADQGFAHFRTSTLAREVGLAEGTIFRHFESLQDILDMAIELMQERLASHFEVEPTTPGDPEDPADPIARLGTFFLARAALVAEQPSFYRLFLSSQLRMAVGEEGAARLDRMRGRTIEFVRSCLEDAEAGGQLAEGLSVEILVLLVTGAMVSLALHGDLLRQDLDQAEQGPQVWAGIRQIIRRR